MDVVRQLDTLGPIMTMLSWLYPLSLPLLWLAYWRCLPSHCCSSYRFLCFTSLLARCIPNPTYASCRSSEKLVLVISDGMYLPSPILAALYSSPTWSVQSEYLNKVRVRLDTSALISMSQVVLLEYFWINPHHVILYRREQW